MSFRGYYMYVLTHLSISNAVQNPKKKLLESEIFEMQKIGIWMHSVTKRTSAKKSNRKELLDFLNFLERTA